MVTEVIEEVDDVVVSPDVIVPGGGGGGHEGHTALGPPLALRARGSPCPSGRPHSRLLEAPHAVQDVELLPAFGEVHLPVDVVWVPQVDEGEVLQDEPPGRQTSW